MNPFEAHYSSPRFFGLALMGLGFVSLGLVETGLIGERFLVQEPTFFNQALGFLCCVFFGGFSIRCMLAMCDDNAVIRIDEAGILDREVSRHLIPWCHIECIEIHRQQSTSVRLLKSGSTGSITYHVSLNFELSSPSLWARWNGQLHKILFGNSHLLKHSVTDRRFVDFISAIGKFAPRQLKLDDNCRS